MTATESMYQEIILDHYKHPQHRGALEPFDAEVHHVNPTCGDEVTLRVQVADGAIAGLGWEGEGCSISQASTSVMSGLVVGRSVPEALALEQRFLALMQSRGDAMLSEDEADELDDAVAFEGVAKYPARVKCALLGWMAMKSAVAEATELGRDKPAEQATDISALRGADTSALRGADTSALRGADTSALRGVGTTEEQRS